MSIPDQLRQTISQLDMLQALVIGPVQTDDDVTVFALETEAEAMLSDISEQLHQLDVDLSRALTGLSESGQALHALKDEAQDMNKVYVMLDFMNKLETYVGTKGTLTIPRLKTLINRYVQDNVFSKSINKS